MAVAEYMMVFFRDAREYLYRLSDDLRPDPVTGQQCDLFIHRDHSFTREANSPPLLMMFWIKGGKGWA